MNDKEHVEFLANTLDKNLTKQREERVEYLVDMLLAALYQPDFDGDRIIIPDFERMKAFGIDCTEPFNFGKRITCSVKEYSDESYQVIIYDAEPGRCSSLYRYIEKYMIKNGWVVDVESRW